MDRRGFSLFELMLVIGLVVLVGAALLPTLCGAGLCALLHAVLG